MSTSAPFIVRVSYRGPTDSNGSRFVVTDLTHQLPRRTVPFDSAASAPRTEAIIAAIDPPKGNHFVASVLQAGETRDGRDTYHIVTLLEHLPTPPT